MSPPKRRERRERARTPGCPAELSANFSDDHDAKSDNDRRTALVIGCGYLGTQLLRELAGIGWQATGITLSESSAEILRNQGLQVAAADLRTSDYQLLTKNNPTVIIHCASSGKGGPAAYREIFLETTERLIKETSCKHLIFTSSTSVYAQTDGSAVAETTPAEPERETGKILIETEEMVLAHQGTVLRLGGIYGPGRCIPLDKLLSGEAAIEGNGERIMNSIHRTDAVSAFCLAVSAEFNWDLQRGRRYPGDSARMVSVGLRSTRAISPTVYPARFEPQTGLDQQTGQQWETAFLWLDTEISKFSGRRRGVAQRGET